MAETHWVPDIRTVTTRTQNVAKTIESSQQPAVRAAANAARLPMEAAAVAARTKGITVRSKFFSSGTTGAGAWVKYGPNPGWVHIMDAPTQAHFIGPRGRGKGSLRKQGSIRGSRRASRMAIASLFGGTVAAGENSAINIKGIGPKAYAFHPGTKGKHFAAIGIRAAEPVATNAYQQYHRNAIRRAASG